jgi:uncharacterized protein with PIN domain
VPDEKDRFGEKLRNLEKAREDQWAAQHDRELLERLRLKQAELRQAVKDATEAMGSLCPHCNQQLVKVEKAGVAVLTCPTDEGMWIEKSEFDKLLQRLK